MSDRSSLAILGAGAFASALAVTAAKAGRPVTLIARDAESAGHVQRMRRSPRLSDVELPSLVDVTTAGEALADADILLLAVPAQATAQALGAISQHIGPGTTVVACAKGVERKSGRLQSAIIAETVPGASVAVLSGPGFAAEIARGLPTAVVIAAADRTQAVKLCERLSTPTFRPYASSDLVGVEIAGAIKNVLAIACGVAMGRKLGESARAALIARGLAEMTRLGVAMGARAETFLGLSGVGDLVLTATSIQSRNTRFGEQLGAGANALTLVGPDQPLVEGYHTAEIARALAARHGVDMPIIAAVADVVAGRCSVNAAIEALITRPLTSE